ncbi:MAG TPA: maleylpyruvate isomerase N-terminal domain-containing protein [Acidimicrobiales bacterium]|nr:maleylpyruvate isomerase N-terminal domain-containing protein [Acidimicrobiales bacterium]
MTFEPFLRGARVVSGAISSPLVAERWDAPSVLADQTVAGLAGHLARSGVWVVLEYLDQPVPLGPADCGSAAAYYSAAAGGLSEDDHRAIRRRGADIGGRGHAAVTEEVAARLAELEARLPGEDPDRLVPVIGGAVMRLEDYLETRVVEQVVHLLDLAASVGCEPWPIPEDCQATAARVGLEIGLRRFGPEAVIRALYRDTGSDVLPVI